MHLLKFNKIIIFFSLLPVSFSLYGGINLANQIQSSGASDVFITDEAPYIEKRGVKYNVTLDRRTPSYGSGGDASANAVAHNWDMSFWTEYIDQLALYKYNVLSLWNLNPFPSLVITEGFESLSLNNVEDMNGNVILKWSIQEKIQFWKDVMAYAKSKGFEIYIFNWNVKTNGTNLPDRDNPQTKSYLRNSLYALFETYPDLDGFGFHSGENMGSNEGFNSDPEREAWLYDVYGQAFENFKLDYPDRELRLIHRLWATQLPDIMPYWGNLSYPMDASIKYSRAHLYSHTAPRFFETDGTKSDLDLYNKKTWLNLRNDDIFYYRWGDPDYVREYVQNLPDPVQYTAGFYIGSDGYEWSRVFTSKNPLFQGDLEINKHWYSHMIWGQLGYDPNTPNQYFIDAIADHFSGAPAQDLFDAWRYASKIFPKVTSAFWRDWDYQWYVEGCYSTYGFRTVQDFIATEPQNGAPIYSIKEYRSLLLTGQTMEKETPIEVSERLCAWADSALALAATINDGGNTELMLTLNDIKAMSYMGYYYSDKIAGATYLHCGDIDKAADYLQTAYCDWNKVAEIASAQYYDQELSRLGNQDFSWNHLKAYVSRELDISNNGVRAGHCDAEAPPEAPTAFTVILNNDGTAVDLSWTDNASDENFFKIKRSEVTGSDTSVIAIVPADSTHYTDMTIISSMVYAYSVCASNPAGDSEYSNTDTVATANIPSGQVPWVEDFSESTDGAIEDRGTTRWSIDISSMGNLSGTFSVQYEMFDVCDTDGDGIWISEKIDISTVSAVDFSVRVRSTGGLDDTGGNYDYVKVLIQVDQGEKELIQELKGKVFNNSGLGALVTKQNITGDSLQIFIHGSTSYNDEHYYIDDISVVPVTTGVMQNDTKSNLSQKFELKQNWPNPFNAITRIDYSLSEKSTVSLTIYNLTGTLVFKTIREEKESGNYSVYWDASQYSSGTYFIQLKVNHLATIKKCLFLK